MSQPVPKPPVVTLNVARGLKHMFRGLIERFPHGDKAISAGLGEVIDRAIDQSPEVPKGDFTAIQLAERLGILQPEKPKRRRKA